MLRITPSSPAVSVRMAKVATRDTAAEMAVRRELHRRGFRYRVNQRIPEVGGTKPDIVFSKERVAIFVDGCFWHRCPEHASYPRANADWWATKLERNVERDQATKQRLEEQGWHVVRIWEHVAPTEAADIVQAAVLQHRPL